jgi:CheY-like chemotaxis protein
MTDDEPAGVLIVDDHADMRMLVRMLVEIANHGLYVTGEVGSGDEALDVLDDTDPKVVVLDQMMPGRSGVDTATLMLQRRPTITIILFSAYLDDDLRRRAETAGIAACVPKEHTRELAMALSDLVA